MGAAHCFIFEPYGLHRVFLPAMGLPERGLLGL